MEIKMQIEQNWNENTLNKGNDWEQIIVINRKTGKKKTCEEIVEQNFIINVIHIHIQYIFVYNRSNWKQQIQSK